MQIEITGKAEELMQAALASGQYASAEEFIEAMVADWERTQKRPGDETLPTMPRRIDLQSLLTEQGIKPCRDPNTLATDLWPREESTDEFLAFLKRTRNDRGDRVHNL